MLTACSPTRHIPEGRYLLQSNTVKLEDARNVPSKSTLTDNLSAVVAQKPNSRLLGMRVKLFLYNLRYNKYKTDSANYQLQSRTVEPPVLWDSTSMRRALQNMNSVLFNQGFFYAKVEDTAILKGKKAEVVYEVTPGKTYRIDDLQTDIEDSAVSQIIRASLEETILKKGTFFSMGLLEEERGRLSSLVRNAGYYRFSADNISFVIDTLSERTELLTQDPFEVAAAAFTKDTAGRDTTVSTLDLKLLVRQGSDSSAYYRYRIGQIVVYPDFEDASDYTDPTIQERQLNDVTFRYNHYYLRESVLFRNIFFDEGQVYSQDDYDKTVTRLNDLGVFQSVRIALNEDTGIKESRVLNCTIFMYPTKKYDLTNNFEVSSANTYVLGSALSVGLRDRNVARSASQFAVTVSAGIELLYDENREGSFTHKFYIRSRNLGLNTSLNIPKFLVPFKLKGVSKASLPHTIISLGTSLLDRAEYFTLVNTTASFGYNWRQTISKTWDLTPAFVTLFQLPKTSQAFQSRLDTNTFLANSYREVTIEGESAAFTFSNNEKKRGANYSYLKLGAEEAGALVTGLATIGGARARKEASRQYAHYLRFDIDGRHFVTFPKATFATRLAIGVGLPYGGSKSLPYIKQYFVGGAYSIRGWRVRTLGPGSYYNAEETRGSNLIDRTGDIRIEGTAEHRFDLVTLFGGSIKLAGAAFVDAGNIWLAQPDSSYPGGELRLATLAHDIAASVGTGLRFNIGDFITFRIDAGIPVKKPYSPNRGGWVFNEIQPGNASWRRENVNISFAVGYPF